MADENVSSPVPHADPAASSVPAAERKYSPDARRKRRRNLIILISAVVVVFVGFFVWRYLSKLRIDR